MCDASDLLSITLDATFEEDDPSSDTPRPTTPLPGRPRTLRRTISYASIDTVCPPSGKGIRRRIEEISNNLKQKSARKQKKYSSAQGGPKNAAIDTKMDSNVSTDSKAAKRRRKSASPLRDLPLRSDEESVLDTADRLHNGVPFEPDLPLTISACKPGPLVDVPLFKEDDEIWEDCSLPIRTFRLGTRVAAECQDADESPSTTKAGIEDVQLYVRPSETDVTIWDGLHAMHHVYKCRLFLRCTTCPYDGASLPDIQRVEVECSTRPAGSPYARPPALQASYNGAAPSYGTDPGELPKVNLAAGIHMDRVWSKTQDDDGMWGWYRDAFVPLSPRLFDKMEYRQFKLIGRVWMGESRVEDELTFGISMLLRELDMD